MAWDQKCFRVWSFLYFSCCFSSCFSASLKHSRLFLSVLMCILVAPDTAFKALNRHIAQSSSPSIPAPGPACRVCYKPGNCHSAVRGS